MNLQEQIFRIKELMGVSVNKKFPILKESIGGDNLIGDFLKELGQAFGKNIENLTEKERLAINNFLNEYNEKFGKNLSSNYETKLLLKSVFESLNDNDITDILSNSYLRYNDYLLAKNATQLISTDDYLLQFLKNNKVKNPFTNVGDEDYSVFDFLSYVYNTKNGDITKINNPSLLPQIKSVLTYTKEQISDKGFINDYINNLIKQIDETMSGGRVVDSDVVNTIKKEIPKLKDNLNEKTTSSSDILNTLANRDQDIRKGETIDVDVDFDNQEQLKKILGDDPQKFIDEVEDINDLDNIWIITQHADNDIGFQNKILDLFTKNKDKFIEKFPEQEEGIKSRIAMLTDRIMVNNNTSVQGYRNTGKSDFSNISNGTQKYGTQGGHHNGKWVPRPIEMEGKTYFFQTPDELYNDSDFLTKINTLRSENGLEPLEEYVKYMQGY